MSSFRIPPPSVPILEIHVSHIPRALPLTLRGALEVLHTENIMVVEVGGGLSNCLGSFHHGVVYVYLVPDAQIGRACTLIHQLGFKELPRPTIPAFETPIPTLVICPRSVAAIDDDDLEYSESRSAYHPDLLTAVNSYINILCRTPNTESNLPILLHVRLWLLGLVEGLKGGDVLEGGKPPLHWLEWVRVHYEPDTEEEKGMERASRRYGVACLNSVQWAQEQLWMKEVLQKLINYEFELDRFTKQWWETNTGTDVKGRPL